MEIISSSSNSRIKLIRKLRDRKERDQSGLFFCEGLRIVAEAVQQNSELVNLFVSPELLVSEFGQQLVSAVERQGVPICEMSADLFRQISSKDGPQGIAALIRQRWTALKDVDPQKDQSWVGLVSPQDPGNVGTILRTHDAVGGEGLILIDHATDPYDPAAARGSMGALFTQKLVKTDWETFIKWKRERKIPLVGTSGSAVVDYHTFDYPNPMVLLMGSEREGLSTQQIPECDHLVAIPMLGKSDSLNLAIATGVVLYEAYNHRRDNARRRDSGGGMQ